MLLNSLTKTFTKVELEAINKVQVPEPLTARQEALVEVLVQNNFDNIELRYYANMSVSDISEAMEVAHKRLELMKSTPLGRALA
jgi:hypothetical protein